MYSHFYRRLILSKRVGKEMVSWEFTVRHRMLQYMLEEGTGNLS